MNREPPRRTVLLAGAAGAGVAALSACAKGGGNPARVSSQPAGTELVALAAVPVGGAKSVTLPGGGPAIVARPTAATAVCFNAVCTHAGCTVAPHGAELDCPCHGSVFDAFTGAVRNGPASQPLQRIPVRVVAGKVVTG